MDTSEFRAEILPLNYMDQFYNYGIKEQVVGGVSPNIHNRLFRAYARFGSTYYNGGITPAIEVPDPYDYYCMGCRYQYHDTLGHDPARNIEWELCGTQAYIPDLTPWVMTDKETFKTQLISYYTDSMNTDALIPFYKQELGENFRDLDYNVIIYWGYPTLPDGTPYGELVTYECIYIGNSPLADEIITA